MEAVQGLNNKMMVFRAMRRQTDGLLKTLRLRHATSR
jgi:hypothetical protein